MAPIPPVTKTLAKIESDLNNEGKGTWFLLDHYYALTTPKINGKNKVDYNLPESGLVLRAFLNLSTLEVRTFVAKFTDDKSRNDLFE